jgi:hypothetical protein
MASKREEAAAEGRILNAKECALFQVLTICINGTRSKEEALQALAAVGEEAQSQGIKVIEEVYGPHYREDLAKRYDMPVCDECGGYCGGDE